MKGSGLRGFPAITGLRAESIGCILLACAGVSALEESAMYRATVAAGLLFTSLALVAQSPVKTQTQTLIHRTTVDNTCPVSMDARQGIWDHTIRVENGQSERPSEGFGQRITLTLVDIHSAKIVGATVKVLGLSGKNRMLSADLSSNASPDASRVIQLSSFSEVKNGVTTQLDAPGFTAVTSIQLLAVTYADGSKWTTPQSKACHVTPDLLMLVAAH
jgi:hypothetical protein